MSFTRGNSSKFLREGMMYIGVTLGEEMNSLERRWVTLGVTPERGVSYSSVTPFRGDELLPYP